MISRSHAPALVLSLSKYGNVYRDALRHNNRTAGAVQDEFPRRAWELETKKSSPKFQDYRFYKLISLNMDKQSNNCYTLLGVEPSADSSSIAAIAKAKVDQINQAFRTLNDPQQRELYDIQLASKPAAENFYALFGIESDVDVTIIKAAARAKAVEIDKAFRILIDPEKRKIYDESLTRTTTRSRRTKRYVNTVGSVSPRESIFKQWYARLADNLSTFETPSMQDIVIFILALLFFIYMVSLFF